MYIAGDRLLNGENVNDGSEMHNIPKIAVDNADKVKYINKATFPNMSTPLMKAAVNAHVSCVRVLILAGAEINLKNALGQTAKKIVQNKIQKIKAKMGKKNNLDVPELESLETAVGSSTLDSASGSPEDSDQYLGDYSDQHSALLERYEKCAKALEMSSEEIRMEDSAEVMGFDASRRDSHIKTFENQALNLKQELEVLIENSEDTWCEKKDRAKKDDVIEKVVKQFKDLLEKHKTKKFKWYNDGGKYRSAVSEMLSMKENAMAVPKLSLSMFEEWENKQTFLRQANRMVNRESLMALRERPEGSEQRRCAALELCKSSGVVTEILEE